MLIRDIVSRIEQIAPPALQESYDNAGLITGSPDTEATGALICLDATEEVIDEAISLGYNMVIAHHPIVFGGLKKINGKNYVEKAVIKAIRNDIAIYAAHTNLDNVLAQGVNQKIAEKIGLVNHKILAPKKGLIRQLFTYVPVSDAEKVKQALFDAGAGVISEYSECSFSVIGTGTFNASDNTNPYVGEKGQRHHETEERIEMIFPAYLEKAVLNALFKAHPYEEVAYGIITLENEHARIGAGLVGELSEPMPAAAFLQHLKKVMEVGCVRYTNLCKENIQKVALCGGSGSFLLRNAIGAGADVYITGDFKYHEFFDAENKIIIADIGHYESEHFTGEIFFDLISKFYPTFALRFTSVNTNPVKYL